MIVLFLAARWVGSAPDLPKRTQEEITAQLDKEPAGIYLGETDVINNDGIDIWYEHIAPGISSNGTVLLIMGHSTTGINWSNYFCQPLVDSGYHVIRYDNRGTGLSDWIENWDEDNAYDLSDMVDDALAILDDLVIEKAHIVGASMGGMIAQLMAAEHPERVLSLTSIMSSGNINDPELPPVPQDFIGDMQKLGVRYLIVQNEPNVIRFHVAMAELLSGDGPYTVDIEKVVNRTLFEIRDRRGFNPRVGDQHTAAIEKSGSRYELLPLIKIPTLVIHGKDDPLIPFEHAPKYASMIPNVDTLYIDGMGHDIPPMYTKQVHEAMFSIFRKGEDFSKASQVDSD